MNDYRLEVAKEFANKIKSDEIIQIILFGSVARGDDDAESDIDILIISNHRDKIWPNVSRAIADIIIEKQEIVSAHVMSEQHIQEINDFTFMRNIKSEGVPIG